jgi:hypothetical protein
LPKKGGILLRCGAFRNTNRIPDCENLAHSRLEGALPRGAATLSQ